MDTKRACKPWAIFCISYFLFRNEIYIRLLRGSMDAKRACKPCDDAAERGLSGGSVASRCAGADVAGLDVRTDGEGTEGGTEGSRGVEWWGREGRNREG